MDYHSKNCPLLPIFLTVHTIFLSPIKLLFFKAIHYSFYFWYFPGGSGLCDPCETGVVDASAKLTAQERANITLSAQVRKDTMSVPSQG